MYDALLDVHYTEYSEQLKPTSKKAAIYARVALDENNALKNQADMLVQKAESVGDDKYSVYYEVGSGLETERPELMRLLADIEKGEYSRLYIKDWDRLLRDILHIKGIVDRIKSANVEIVITV